LLRIRYFCNSADPAVLFTFSLHDALPISGAGFWFDDRRTSGIETSFFQLGDAATNFRASSDGNSILARPFLDATTTRQDALLIADRKSTRLNSSHQISSYAVFCLKKK